jgi:hypothetical protein
MLPTALAYIVIMAGAILALDAAGVPSGRTILGILSPYWLILGALNLVLAVVLFVILDRGRIISPAYARMPAERVARLRRMSERAIAPAQGD